MGGAVHRLNLSKSPQACGLEGKVSVKGNRLGRFPRFDLLKGVQKVLQKGKSSFAHAAAAMKSRSERRKAKRPQKTARKPRTTRTRRNKKRVWDKGGFGWLIVAVFVCFLLILAEEQGVFNRWLKPKEPVSPPSSSASSVSEELPPADDLLEEEPPKELEVYFLDVGQGDSELVRIPDGDDVFCALIDSGEYVYADRLTNLLRGLGVERIDALICTHPHTDHIGSMARIVQRFEIGMVYMPRLPDDQVPTTAGYEALLDALEEKELAAVPLCSGTEIFGPDSVEFQVIAPETDDLWSSLNNYSGVIRMVYGDTAFLFAGDAEKESESRMLKQGYELEADVLKCGHHGSRTSTSAKFLKAVNPQYAVISCGEDNYYGHPHEQVLEKLNMLGTNIYRTDMDKTILARSDGTWITFTTGLTLMDEEE